MKYTIKHPNGTTHDLTIEEMQSTQLIQQLQIDASWSVKDGEIWVSLNAFLWEQTQKQNQQPTKKPNKKDNAWRNALLAADATWCPGSVFGLVVRLLGLYFIWHGTEGFVDLITGFPPIIVPSLRGITVPPTNPRFITVLLISIGYFITGLYLIRKPHDLVSLAFPKD
ncbi:MAG: hypothetical protein HOH33_12635 [Verrucomicrobia bacterium]|jgi:hypothetical protein|nr:hypothetical protein [Verrucomicrobiota bacterium]